MPVINPRHMLEGYGSCSVCVCVCYHANCYIRSLFFVKIKVSVGFPCCFQFLHYVDFAETTLFKSSGDI